MSVKTAMVYEAPRANRDVLGEPGVRRCLVLLLTILTVLSLAHPAVSGTVLSSHFEGHDPDSTMTVDNKAWADFLARYVRAGSGGLTLVSYGMVTNADRQALKHYLATLQATPVSQCSRPEQLAFWINLYNALTVQLVLQHYPIASIRDIAGPTDDSKAGPWEEKIAKVEGQALSLHDIQQGILLPIWRDARVIYALSCAAISCPSLRPAPYSPSRIDDELDAAAIAYVNSSRGVRILGDRLIVSRLYEWHKAEFGGTENGIIRHLLAYAAPDMAMRLQQINHIDGFQFDWALNGKQ